MDREAQRGVGEGGIAEAERVKPFKKGEMVLVSKAAGNCYLQPSVKGRRKTVALGLAVSGLLVRLDGSGFHGRSRGQILLSPG